MKSEGPVRSIAKNKKARHAYHVLEELECGIVLAGTEVKSLRQGRCSLQEAFATVKAGELFLVGLHIPEYSHGTSNNHKPVHDRKLLARKREIESFYKQARERGITMIPLDIYFKGSLVKVKIGLCKGKKLYDKREVEKERTDKRDMDRAARRGR